MPDEPFPEVGRCLHLEHVNFELDGHDLATDFFIVGSGFTCDPYKRADDTNIGVNVGLLQFHLPRRGNRTPPLLGLVGLVVLDLEGQPGAVVSVGAHQSLRYRDRALESFETHSFHVAIYTTDYNALRRTLKDQDAFMGDALNQTFFFNRLFDPDSGETLIPFSMRCGGCFIQIS